MHFTSFELHLKLVITCTVQTESHHNCTEVPHNTGDTPQNANNTGDTPQNAIYHCYIALSCGITCTVQIESHQCCSAVHRHVTCKAQITNHKLCGAVMHNAMCTLLFARSKCCISKPYHSANCKSSLLYCSNILQKWEEILIPAVSLLQSGLTTGDMFNVWM